MVDYSIITKQILDKAPDFGFLKASVASIKIADETKIKFNEWLNAKFHGTMDYLANNRQLRFHPELLHHGTISIIIVQIPYLTKMINSHKQRLKENNAYISSYALGRDYHKVVKQNLEKYTSYIKSTIDDYNFEFNYRVFTDSAPILEVELAKNAGLGWRGKNTLLLSKENGSMFFLGEIFTNLPLNMGSEVANHCGSCNKCIVACPTNAFIEPYVLDASKCISYFTIEYKGSIPVKYRKAIGNRIYGCDDCQLVCPWNKFSKLTNLSDFNTRHNLDTNDLIEMFNWDESTWKSKMSGSSIYRIGYVSWLRNLAIALGNAKTSINVIEALRKHLNHQSSLVREHIKWALEQHNS